MTSSWKKKRERIRQKFSAIANKDLTYKTGHELEMVTNLKNKLEKSTKEILSIFIEF
jgi:hypothetical protein